MPAFLPNASAFHIISYDFLPNACMGENKRNNMNNIKHIGS